MILSDGTIRSRIESGDLVIHPFEPNNVEPASVDLRLSNDFEEIVSTGTIDTRGDDVSTRSYQSDSIILNPSDTVLASTQEYIEIPDDLCADIKGRSSIGRLFVCVHETAGFGDPGWEGDVTLELVNDGRNPIKLYEGQRVCQIIFKELDAPAERPYGHSGSQYQGQRGATRSGMQFD